MEKHNGLVAVFGVPMANSEPIAFVQDPRINKKPGCIVLFPSLLFNTPKPEKYDIVDGTLDKPSIKFNI